MNVKCEHCGQDYEVDESMTGSKAECEVCAGKFVITPIIESESVPPVTVMAEVENEDDDLILGLYRLEGEAAEGGMGKVYRVHHTTWNVDLAMKQPHAHMFETQAQKDTFAHECDAWINLGLHPHIVSCYYVREIDGIPSIFAEWMEGGDLTHAARDGKINSLERILDIAIQFAWGLGYAHEQGLIHQDVKPENVMLDSKGGVKVADFGIANAKRDIGISTSMTAQFDGTMISEAGAYTPAYCSPEQANKDKLTKRTDIWSWAVSILEMFLGERLWESGVVAGLACEDYFESVKVPIPESVKDLLRNCFKENEAERPHDFKTIVDKLLEIYQSEIGKRYSREAPKSAADTLDSLNNRALSYLDIGQPEKAEQLWEQALKIDKLHLEATYNQGLYLWRSGKIDDMELIRRFKAVRLGHTGSWRSEYLLGIVHLARGDAKSALPLLKSAIKQSSNDPDVVKAMKIATNRHDKGQCFRTFGGASPVTFSPDGKFALSGSGYKTLRLWDIASGQCIRTFEGHTKEVYSVSFSSDGKFVLSGSEDKTIKLWDVETGECLRTFEGHACNIFSVNFSPDGKLVLGSTGKTLRLWNVETGQCLHIFEGHTNYVDLVSFSPDGKSALSRSKTILKLWNIETGECIRTFKGGFRADSTVNFSPDGKFILSGGDLTMKLWNVETGQCLRTFEGHTERVYLVSFSPDGKFALSGSGDKTLKLWDIASGQCLKTFEGHTSYAKSVSFSPDNKFALLGSKGITMELWDIMVFPAYANWELCRIRTVRETLDYEQRFTGALREAKKKTDDGDIFAALTALASVRSVPGSERTPKYLELNFQAGRYCRTKGFHLSLLERSFERRARSIITSVSFSPDGKLVLGSMDNILILWDVKTGHCLRVFEGRKKRPLINRQSYVNSVSFSPDGKYILSASGSYMGTDNKLKLWNVETGKCFCTFEEHTLDLFSEILNPNRKSTLEKEIEKRIEKAKNIFTSVSFSPDGKFALSSSLDNILKLWDVMETGQCIRTFEGGESPVTFSPDGKFALSRSGDKTLKLWDIASGQCLRIFEGHSSRVNSVSFSPDGKFVLSGSGSLGADNTLKLWDVKSGQCLRTFEGHTNNVNSVDFSPDGKFALSGSGDKTLKLWDIASGQCLRTFEEGSSPVSFSPDGKYALSGSNDKTIKLWRLDWEYEFPGWVDWDEGAEPYLRIFLTLHPEYTEDDVQKLLTELQYRGYGWLRPEGVRKKLKMVVDSVEPHLRDFLTQHTKRKGIFRQKISYTYIEEDIQKLLTELQYRGYGWLRPEGVRKKLEEMTGKS